MNQRAEQSSYKPVPMTMNQNLPVFPAITLCYGGAP